MSPGPAHQVPRRRQGGRRPTPCCCRTGCASPPHTTRQDWTNEILDQIRGLYQKYSDPSGGTKVALQGLVWDGKEGGRLPVEKYVAATLAEREALRSGQQDDRRGRRRTRAERASTSKPSGGCSPAASRRRLLDDLRARWRTAKPDDAAALVGRDRPLAERALEVQHRRPHRQAGRAEGVARAGRSARRAAGRPAGRSRPTDAGEVTLYLVASDCGDGNDHDFVVWQQPRFVAPGRPDLLLQGRAGGEPRPARPAGPDVRRHREVPASRRRGRGREGDGRRRRRWRRSTPSTPTSWAAGSTCSGIGTNGPVKLTGHFTTKISNVGKHEFVKGWGSDATPAARRQLVGPARPHPRRPEGARRRRPPVADAERRGRLAEPDRRNGARRAEGRSTPTRRAGTASPGPSRSAAGRPGSGWPPASRQGTKPSRRSSPSTS